MKQVVVLAGGLGTRMLPRTERTPKVLLSVAGQPFLFHLVLRLARCGFDEALFALGHLANEVQAALESPAVQRLAGRMRLLHCVDGGEQQGTAMALRSALPLLQPTFVVTYGDSYLPYDYGAPLRLLERYPQEADGCMAVFENHDAHERSNAAVVGERVTHYQKHASEAAPRLTFIDYGALALKRSVIEGLPERGSFGLDRVQSQLAASGKLLAHRASERFYEIGSESGLRALEQAFAEQSPHTLRAELHA
jgi:MurNAc alpha-1-phosphate uridylyltransferase